MLDLVSYSKFYNIRVQCNFVIYLFYKIFRSF